MKSLVTVAFLSLAATVCNAEVQMIPSQAPDGSVSINMVSSQKVVEVGPEKDGKRAVVLFLGDKRYEGTVVEIKPAPEPKAPKK